MPRDAFAKRRMSFQTKTGVSKISYSKKKILPPVTSFDILKIVCQEAEKALVAKPCVLVQKRRAKLMESPKVVPSNQGGKRVTWLGKNPFHIPSLPFRLSPWLQ